MRFVPKTEEECARGDLLPEGTYETVVRAAEEQTSKAGNDMLKLTLDVYGPDGVVVVWDYLLEKMAHKLRHFCYACGLEKKYEAGTLTAEDCEGHTVATEIVVKKSKDPKYSDQNAVEDYQKFERGGAAPAVKAAAKGHAPLEDDDIPFDAAPSRR